MFSTTAFFFPDFILAQQFFLCLMEHQLTQTAISTSNEEKKHRRKMGKLNMLSGINMTYTFTSVFYLIIQYTTRSTVVFHLHSAHFFAVKLK